MVRFAAHCQRGHDRVEFTEPAEFERHMRTEHKARKIATRRTDPYPWKAPEAPADTRKLTAVLVKAACGRYDPRYSSQDYLGEWITEEWTAPTDLAPGDKFVLPVAPGVEYVVLDTDPERGWHLERLGDSAQAGKATRGWLRELKLKGSPPVESVIIVGQAT